VSSSAILAELGDLAWSVAGAILPLALLFVLFQLLVLKLPHREVVRIATGTLMAAIGLFLFLVGVGLGFLPFGRAIGEALGSLQQAWLLVPFGIVLGFVTTWGEPSVRILADQVEEASTGSIRRSLVVWTVCFGVALAVGLGMLRIGYGISLLHLLVPGYVLVIAMMWWSERRFVAIAIDAGGVATGPLANTFLLALALGVSAALGNENPLAQGLGLVALIALAPVIAVMALGLVVRWKERPKESER
jgi:hypothetical protein